MENQNTTGKTSLVRSSQIEDYHHSFMVKVAEGRLMPSDLKINPVQARFNALPMNQSNEVMTVAALTKVISDAFVYYNTLCEKDLIKMVVSDIMDVYSRFSILEMVKAITQGRRMGGDLYGRLSGKHIMEWIAVYESETMAKVAEYRRNEKYKAMDELDGLKLPDEFTKGLIDVVSLDKAEYTHEEKQAQLLAEQVSEDERLRREHGYKWSREKTGMSYEDYMKEYDKSMEN